MEVISADENIEGDNAKENDEEAAQVEISTDENFEGDNAKENDEEAAQLEVSTNENNEDEATGENDDETPLEEDYIKHDGPEAEENGNQEDGFSGELERRDSGFSVESTLINREKEVFTWPPLIEDSEVEEEELEEGADSEHGVQVWDDTIETLSSSEFIAFGEVEEHEGIEEYDTFVDYANIITEVPEDVFDLPEATEIEEEGIPKRESDEGEDPFAPKIDSLREILDDEYIGEEEEETADVEEPDQSKQSEEIVQEEEEEEYAGTDDIEDNIVVLVQPDESMILLPTPIVSDMSLLVENNVDLSDSPTDIIDPSQRLAEKMSLIDVTVLADEPIIETHDELIIEKEEYWKFIPGIGPVVPNEIIFKALKYLKEVSEYQERMVMPRNLRHYKCPPLENFASVFGDNISLSNEEQQH